MNDLEQLLADIGPEMADLAVSLFRLVAGQETAESKRAVLDAAMAAAEEAVLARRFGK